VAVTQEHGVLLESQRKGSFLQDRSKGACTGNGEPDIRLILTHFGHGFKQGGVIFVVNQSARIDDQGDVFRDPNFGTGQRIHIDSFEIDSAVYDRKTVFWYPILPKNFLHRERDAQNTIWP
jgi:hypothetical protein